MLEWSGSGPGVLGRERRAEVVWWGGPQSGGCGRLRVLGREGCPGISLGAEESGRREGPAVGLWRSRWRAGGPSPGEGVRVVSNGNLEVRTPGGGRWAGPGPVDSEGRGRGVSRMWSECPRAAGDQSLGPGRVSGAPAHGPATEGRGCRAPEPPSPVGQAHALEEAGECGVDAARPEVCGPHGPLLVAPPGQRVAVRRRHHEVTAVDDLRAEQPARAAPGTRVLRVCV